MRAFLATPPLCLGLPHHRVIERTPAPSPDLTRALDAVTAFARAPSYRRAAILRVVESLIDILDAMDGDADLEPSGGDIDHLPDDDRLHPLDAAPVGSSSLIRREGRRHVG